MRSARSAVAGCGFAVLMLCIAVASGCASIPAPREEVSMAQLAMRRADAVEAGVHAPLEMRLAREQLVVAREAMSRADYHGARWAAEKALVDAELASAKARTARELEIAEAIRNDIDALREEAERASERVR